MECKQFPKMIVLRTAMKMIPVYLKENRYDAEVDDEDYEFLSQYRWTAKPSKRKRTVYAHANHHAPLGRYVNIAMHRMIIGDAVDAIEDDDVSGSAPT